MRYVHLPAASVDTALLEDATRRGMLAPARDFVVDLPLIRALQRLHNKLRKHGDPLPRQVAIIRQAGWGMEGTASLIGHDNTTENVSGMMNGGLCIYRTFTSSWF